MKLSYSYLAAILAAGVVLFTSALYAQAPAASPAAGPEVQEKTLIEQLKQGGWVMWFIGAASIAMVWLIGDGAIRTSRKKMVPPEHVEALRNFFRQGDYTGAYNFCKANPSPMNNIVRVGVSFLGDGKQMTELAMSEELTRENAAIQTRISYLSVIGVCAPMLGLLGTVTGMIRAFATLGSSGIGDPSKLSSAIGEVLVATASGLFIAIPAFMGFYFLRNRAIGGFHYIEDVINSLFRKMPYELIAGVHIGDEELYAATPNWIALPDHPAGEGAPEESRVAIP